MIETLEVKKRDALGSLKVQKLRRQGYIPAILYGHGESNVCLALSRDAVHGLIKHGSKLVSLVGDVSDTALLRDVQWDSFGSEVIHLDFARVSRSELVEITLPIELHGEAPGTHSGGQLRFITHEMAIKCPADRIPEHIVVEIGELQLGQSIHANEVKLPEGASAVTAASVVIVQVVQPTAKADEVATGAAAEPEVIGKKDKPEAGA